MKSILQNAKIVNTFEGKKIHK